jgi:hypothetical protein
MFTVEIELTQHTPLIHFNALETGASLRLTELKPKLDRYLEKVIGRDIVLRDHKFWLNKYDFSKSGDKLKGYLKELDISFDYSVQFGETPRSSQVDYLKKSRLPRGKSTPFFAELGNEGDDEKYGFIQSSSAIKIKFTSKHSDLLSLIPVHIHNFLDETNFGTRQSKGFGSFTEYKSNNKLPFKFTIPLDKRERKDVTLFNAINLFYKCLRSGINELDRDGNNTFYFKSLLFMYAKDPSSQWGESIQWDKKTIKQHFFLNAQSEQKTNFDTPDEMSPLWYSNENKLMIRDLLGLSSSEQWRSYRSSIEKEVENDLISRFKSPIIFKPYLSEKGDYYTVHFGGTDTPSLANQKITVKRRGGDNLNLKTPGKFDINEYLTWVVGKKLKVHEHANDAFHNGGKKKIQQFDEESIERNHTGRILTSIFNSLSKVETTI